MDSIAETEAERNGDFEESSEKTTAEPTIEETVEVLIARAKDIEAREAQASTPEERAQIERDQSRGDKGSLYRFVP